jgi:hypothetical protein
MSQVIPATAGPRLDFGPAPEACLERLGRLELAGLAAWLPRASRRALDRAVRARAGAGLPRALRRLPDRFLENLGQCLHWEAPGGPGWVARAGLHRLARGLADLEPAGVRHALKDLPPGALEVCLRAHAGLQPRACDRREALALRRSLGQGR